MVSFSCIGRGAQFVQIEKPISNACLFSTCKDGEIGPTCFQTQDWIQPNVKSATPSPTDQATQSNKQNKVNLPAVRRIPL